jgi:hypothetical protein
MAAAGSPAGCSVQHEEGQPRFHGEPQIASKASVGERGFATRRAFVTTA